MKSRSIAVVALAAGGMLVSGLPASAADPDGFGHRGVTTHELARGWHPGHGHGPKPPPTAGEPMTVAENLAGPLTFDVARGGTLYVGQAFAGNLVRVEPGQPPEEIVPSSGTDIAAVSTRAGEITWSIRRAAEGDIGEAEESFLLRRGRDASATSVDLLAYERSANPDGAVAYAFTDLDPACAALLTPPFAPYTGAVDSHAYGSLMLPGVTYVADAGANALLKVDRSGQVSTVALLPPTPVEVTAEIAGGLGLPECVVGHEYNLEPVPTDVELGHDGWLYVSTLPGGPEDGSLGPIGSVYRVNPWTGAVQLFATGFAGATSLAIGPGGRVYVAELYADQVSSVGRDGTVTPLVSLTQPAGLEWSHGRLYVSTDVFGAGRIVSMRVR